MSEDVSSIDGRPPSEMLVDLHVAVVPMDHWVEKLNHASHKVIRDTFSAGFLRVLPETSVAKLRHHIAEQLGKDIFPKDYIFLKHVGRCLALVRQKQERQLKVKNFLPPHSIMPEIYVLPGQPKMYNYSVLPPIKPHFKDLYNPMLDNDSSPTNTRTLRSNAEPISNSRAHVFDNDDSASESFNKSLEIMPQQIQQEEDFDSLKPGRFPVGAPKSNQQLYENLFKVENRTTEKKYDMKHHKRHVSGKSSYDQDLQHSTSSSNFHETQNEVATPDLTFGNSSGNHSNDIPGNHMDLSTDGSQETEEGKKLQQAKSVLHEGPKKRKVRYNMPPESNSNASSQDLDMHEPTKLLTDPTDFDVKHTIRNYEVREHDSSPNHRHKAHFEPSEISLDPQPIPNTYNSAYIQPARPKKQFVNTSSYDLFQPIQSTFRSFDDPYYFKHNTSKVPAARSMDAMHESNQDHSEHVNFSSSTLIANSQPLILNHEKSAIVTGIVVGSATVSQTSEHFEQTRTTSAYEDSGFIEQEQSDSDENNNNKAEERRIYPLYNPEEVNRSAQNGGEESIHAAPTVHNLDMITKDSAVKGQLSSHKDLQRNQPAVVHPESNSSTFVEAPTPLEPIVAKQDKNSDNPIRNFEQDNKKSASNFDRVNLWKELQKIRSERQEAEKKRQELVKQAKISTTKMNQKRSSVRDLWKKKFFEEKKRTLPLEDICRRLQGELDTSHQRLVSAMEGTKPVGTRKFAPILPSTRHAPSMKNNSRIQATRLQHDMDSIRRKIEDAKVKLTGEIKLRHQAEQDVKSMRQELLSKKIRVHIAYRKITRGHHFPLDIKSNA